MAVLGDRATNVLDMIIEGFRNQGQPVEAGSPMQSPMVADVRRSSPVQRELTRERGQFRMQGQPLVVDREMNSPYGARAPYVPTGTQMDTPVAPPSMVPTPAQPTFEANRLVGGSPAELGQGVMQVGADREKMLRAGKVAKDALDTGDESIISQVQDFFGGRENMLRLAMAFNTMRLEPDAQLTAALSKQIEGLQKTKSSSVTQQYVVQWLRDNGYEKYIPLAMQDPKMAAEIAKQIAQKELKPDVAPSYSPVRIDQTSGKLFTVEFDPNTRKTRRIEIDGTGLTEKEKAEIESQARLTESDIAEAQKKGSEFFQKAQSLDSQIAKYTAAMDALDRGAATGWWNEYLPTFRAATQEFKMIANSLGIDIINSATFGALSESELRLALQTGLPDNLNEEETRALIKRKIAAQAKLRDQLYEDAYKLSSGSIGMNQFIRERSSSRLDEINRQRASGTQTATQTAPTPAPQGNKVIRFDRNGNLIQ